MGKLDGRKAIVTGGATGIGLAIAKGFATEGCDVVICGRREDELRQATEELKGAGTHVGYRVVDVRQLDDLETVVDGIAEELGGLHILVNNAGISGPTALEDVTADRWRDILSTNLDGAYFMTRAALLRIQDHAQGRIINIASIGAQSPFPGWTAYCASKAGMVGITKCLAMEVASRGITVNAILPGWVITDMSETGLKSIADDMDRTPEEALPIVLSDVPLGRMSDADEVAAMAVHIASDDGRGMTGSSVVISNGAFMN